MGAAACGGADDASTKSPKADLSAKESACVEVRAGIDAYNQLKFSEVQPHFVDAMPDAKAHAEKSDNRDAADLLEAIEFFADVPPLAYSKTPASKSSFEKYKAITLGQCEYGGPPPQETEDTVKT